MSTNVWGFLSMNGNHELCTCTITRCPRRKVWYASGIVNVMVAGSPATNGSGFSKLFRNLARNGSPRTSC